ncbi:MAG: RraA family protein [Tessaracoccus sp.]|uniref:RraA family protein n=1 Tax=Tessaracoccus sp. TaxID=1971211 RepID=UPI001EC7F6AD|nr:RraA family protein [Tessaracoccus sp.]MBK7822250.1 RraA family protein [Tessaracoccus sp.]
MNSTDEQPLFQRIRERLYTPVICDVLDQLGRRHQFLPPEIRPLAPSMMLVGRAMPVLIDDEFGIPARPFGRLTEALDALEDGEIYVARGGSIPCAAWGEILTATAKRRGAVGAVIDGYHRDTHQVMAQNWPVFSRGSYAQDAGARSSVRDYRVTVEIGSVLVQPRSLMIGDIDGVAVIPPELEDEVLERAFLKVSAESTTRRAIEGGMSSTEAYATFGVL